MSIRLLAAQTDGRLVDLVSRGNERAFEALVGRYRGPLLRYCSRMGLGEAMAEDVVQHSLLKAWLALTGGTPVRELRPWLYRIAHNLAISSMRGDRERPAQLSDTVEYSLHGATPADAEDRLAAREALGHVAALPDMQRHAIVLTAIEGRSHEEAATVMGITDGAVRGLVHRARASIRTAAAAFMPPGLHAWLTRGTEGAGLAERSGEISAGAGIAGLTGLIAKGAVVAATAGLVIAGGAAVRASRRPGSDRHAAHAVRGLSAGGAALAAVPVSAGASTAAPSRQSLQLIAGGSTRALARRPGRNRSASHTGRGGQGPGSSPVTSTDMTTGSTPLTIGDVVALGERSSSSSSRQGHGDGSAGTAGESHSGDGSGDSGEAQTGTSRQSGDGSKAGGESSSSGTSGGGDGSRGSDGSKGGGESWGSSSEPPAEPVAVESSDGGASGQGGGS